MKTEEGNELIAIFLDWKVDEFVKENQDEYDGMAYHPKERFFMKKCKYTGTSLFPDEMKFHKSWNWLMYVIEKIESIQHEDHGYFGVWINSNTCHIQGTKYRSKIVTLGEAMEDQDKVYWGETIAGSKIEATWIQVVKFIEWHDQNIKQ